MKLSEKLKAELFRKLAHFCIVLADFVVIKYINFWLGFAGLFIGLLLLYSIRHTNIIKFATTFIRHKSLGQYYLFIGLIVANVLYLFTRNDLALAFAYFSLGFSDVLAGFVPYFLPQKVDKQGRVLVSTKSLVYSSVVFCLANLVFLLSFKLPVLKVLIITALLGLIEFYSKKGSDNFTIPIAGYLLVVLLDL